MRDRLDFYGVRLLVVFALVFFVFAVVAESHHAPMPINSPPVPPGWNGTRSAPPVGWTTQAKLVRVLDGDTIEVEVSRRFKVRLLECWAPERHHNDGPASTQNLEMLLGGEAPVIVHVPVESGDIEDVWTFGRVLGTVWRADTRGESVNAAQVRQGFATREKQ